MKYGVLLLALFSGWANAQAGEVHGKISDAQGAAIAGARVFVAASPGRGRGQPHREQATTDSDGVYSLTGLEPGVHVLTVSLPGNKASLRRPVNMRSESDSIQVDIQIPRIESEEEHKP